MALVAMLPAAGAMADTFYTNDFETGPLGPEWSSNSVLDAAPAFTRYNGRYSGGYTELTLAQPSANGGSNGVVTPPDGSTRLYHLSFDFFAIDSWDGNATTNNFGAPVGPDWFDVLINNSVEMHETFSNIEGRTQTFRTPDAGRSMMGYNTNFTDAIYRNITMDFTVAEGSPIVIRWTDLGLQGLVDESWGIDNVSLSYSMVPTPGTLGLAGAAGIGLLRRRRAAAT
jgi:hypothetical protein